MAATRQSECLRPFTGDVRVKPYFGAQGVEFASEIEKVKSPGCGNADAQTSLSRLCSTRYNPELDLIGRLTTFQRRTVKLLRDLVDVRHRRLAGRGKVEISRVGQGRTQEISNSVGCNGRAYGARKDFD